MNAQITQTANIQPINPLAALALVTSMQGTLKKRGGKIPRGFWDTVNALQADFYSTFIVPYTVQFMLGYTLLEVEAERTFIYMAISETFRHYGLGMISQRSQEYKRLEEAIRARYAREAAAMLTEIIKPLDTAQRSFIRGVAGSRWGWVQVCDTFPREVADALAALGLIKYDNEVTLELTDYGRYVAAGLNA